MTEMEAGCVLAAQAPVGTGVPLGLGTRDARNWVLPYLAKGSVSFKGLSYPSSAALVGWVSCGTGCPRQTGFVPFLLVKPTRPSPATFLIRESLCSSSGHK